MNPGRRFWWLGVIVPIALCVGHFTVMVVLRPERSHWYISETGPAELGAGGLFLAAAVVAACLFLRFGRTMPRGVRWMWLVYALAAMFVALEEMSYGQHIFRWASPEFFQRVNVQHEMNLHNLGGQGPQRTMRNIGEVLMPVWCLLLPALLMRFSRDAYGPGHWSRYLVPRWEVAVTVLLAGVLRPLLDWDPVILDDKATKEFMEFLWGWAALLLVLVVWRRLRLAATDPAAAAA